VRVAPAQHGMTRQRTAPFLGAACLALLALASVHKFPAELAQLAAGQGLTHSPTTRLAGQTSTNSLLGVASSLVAHGAYGAAPRAGQSPIHVGWPAVVCTLRSRPPGTLLAQGAVSVPALLVSVTLALCH
jgi:hypothetical protein